MEEKKKKEEEEEEEEEKQRTCDRHSSVIVGKRVYCTPILVVEVNACRILSKVVQFSLPAHKVSTHHSQQLLQRHSDIMVLTGDGGR